MDDLAKEYSGRITVARFMVMTRFFEQPSPGIRERLDLVCIPTVILFDQGVEVDRWRLVIMEAVYRHDLNKFLKARAAKAFAKGADVSPEKSVRGRQGD
jgi:thioredoxin-like negative regulator of GroEL